MSLDTLDAERARAQAKSASERNEEEHRYNPFMLIGTEYCDRHGVQRVNCGLGESDNPTLAEFEKVQETKKKAIGGVHRNLLGNLLGGIVGYKLG